jgi:hypothetical protein
MAGVDVGDLSAALPDSPQVRLFEDAFSWIARASADIDRFDLSVRAHAALFSWLATAHRPAFLTALKPFAAATFSELREFCAANPPHFRTTVTPTVRETFAGFSFPPMPLPFMSASIDADGHREATLRLVSVRGEPRSLTLVSPLVYAISARESILFRALEGLPPYPEAFRIHPALTVVVAPLSVRGLRTIVRPPFPVCEPDDGSGDDSPGAVYNRRGRAPPGDALFRWYLSAAGGIRTD